MAKTRMPSGDYAKKLVRLPPELLEKLEKEAARQHRSLNGQLVHTLDKALNSTEAKPSLAPTSP
jgi:predicted HicB family RNase H-like nuclease